MAELHDGLKKMLLTVTYFNRVHAMPIFITKILCMLDFTVGIFIFLKFVRSKPPIAFMGIYVAVPDGSWYAVVYGRAFTVQLGLQEWKQRQLLVGRKNLDREQMKLAERRVKSVPEFGITVGAGFSKFHRGTALDFYDS